MLRSMEARMPSDTMVLLTPVQNAQRRLAYMLICTSLFMPQGGKVPALPSVPSTEAQPIQWLTHTRTCLDALALVSPISLGNSHDLASLTYPEEALKTIKEPNLDSDPKTPFSFFLLSPVNIVLSLQW